MAGPFGGTSVVPGAVVTYTLTASVGGTGTINNITVSDPIPAGTTVQTADLVTGIRPALARDVTELRKVAGNIARNRSELDRAIKVLPIKLTKVGRTAIYGSWFNFYLCDFTGTVRVAGQAIDIPEYPPGGTEPARCKIG